MTAVESSAVSAEGERILGAVELWSSLPSATSRAVLLSAVESFATRGFHATTLRHIAEGTGLSTAALYVHFRSKEEVLFEISRRGHEAALEIVEAAAALPVGPDPAMRVLAYAFTRWHAEQRTTARVVQYEQSALTAEHAEVIGALRRRTERTVRNVIALGVSDGVFDVADVRGACAAVLSLGIDVARWFRPGGPYTPDAIGQLYSELACRLLGATDQPDATPGGL